MRSPQAIQNFLDYVCHVAVKQTIFFLWRPFLADPGDDMILELAVAASCDAIVTHHLKDFRKSADLGIPAISPADFLRQIGGPP